MQTSNIASFSSQSQSTAFKLNSSERTNYQFVPSISHSDINIESLYSKSALRRVSLDVTSTSDLYTGVDSDNFQRSISFNHHATHHSKTFALPSNSSTPPLRESNSPTFPFHSSFMSSSEITQIPSYSSQSKEDVLTDDILICESNISAEEILENRDYEEKSSSGKSIRIVTITWNMGNAAPPSDLSGLIPEDIENIDIIVFGLQESTYTAHEVSTDCYVDLYQHLVRYLGPNFVKVKQLKKEQMQMIVFASTNCVKLISKIQRNAESTGLLHLFPNKGGLYLSMLVGTTSLAFISVHLTAHEGLDKCKDRNSSIEEIFAKVLKGDTLSHHHHVLFLGDLNYRLSFDDDHHSSKSRQEHIGDIMQMIENEQWTDLLAIDELTREMMAGNVLIGFTALVPTFPPSYKRKRMKGIEKFTAHNSTSEMLSVPDGTEYRDYDDEEEDPTEVVPPVEIEVPTQYSQYFNLKRLPSYCDRILYSSLPRFSGAEYLNPLSFEICESVLTSDHKPVRATFDMRVFSSAEDRIPLIDKAAGADLGVQSFIRIDVLELKASNLKNICNGAFVRVTTDPTMIVATSPFKKNDFVTSTMDRTSHPEWTDEVISFRLNTVDLQALSDYAHIFLSVWDRRSIDVFIGTVVVPYRDVIEKISEGCEYELDAYVIDKSSRQGELKGKIMLEVVEDGRITSFRSRPESDGCCTMT